MNVVSFLDRAARLFGGRVAVTCDGTRLTYGALARRVGLLAAALRDHGVGPGDRVAALLPNDHTYLELYFAAPLAGAVLVPLNHRLAPGELASILVDAGARLLVAAETFRSTGEAAVAAMEAPVAVLWAREEGEAAGPGAGLEDAVAAAGDPVPLEAAADAGPTDPAQLYYTSGTTGAPKGVVLTHGNVVFHALMAVAELGLSDRDGWLHAAPMFHLADAWAVFAVTAAGGGHVMAPRFEPRAVLDLLAGGEVTLTNLIPTMLRELVRFPGAGDRTYPSLRLVLSGGAPIAPELVRAVMETFGCGYVQTYGLTETSPYLTLSRLKASLESLPEEERFRYLASTGRPMLGVELRVVDDAGAEVPADGRTVGEIVVRGPSVTPGYWNNPEETRRAFRDGWFCTGDLAVQDPEGYLNIVDRKKDVIVTGGELVYSVEVEHALLEHPAVREAAVVAVPDETWGEAVKAVVALKEGAEASEGELVAFCRARLARYKAPKSVDFVLALPRTGSGKIHKRAVREPYWKGRDKRVH